MIIDAHIHMGELFGMKRISMTTDMIDESMEKYKIDYVIMSNGSGAEVDGNQELLEECNQKNQLVCNEEAIAYARSRMGKVGVLLWARPRLEGCDEEFEALLSENLDVVKGIKIHPYHSKMEFDAPEMKPYLKLCEKYDLPCLVHSAVSYSTPDVIYEVAKEFPKVKIVMAHMGLGTNNERAIELIAKQDNLYGDTAWVKFETACKAIELCGEDKILFGTDSPIDGVDTYGKEDFYVPYFKQGPLSKEAYEKLMFRNAIQVYNISQFEK